MLLSRREHRFQKISVSVVHLDFDREINGVQDASKAAQKRSQTLFKTLFHRLRGSLGALLGGLGLLGESWDAPGTALGP